MQLNFGTGILYGLALTDATGTPVANPTPVQFGNLQDIAIDLQYDTKMLYGSTQFPIDVARGKGKIEIKAKTANFNAAMIAKLFGGFTQAAGIRAGVQNFAASVPGVSTYTITIVPPSAGTFLTDLGVLYQLTGLPLTKVASAPTVGQYSVAAGVYTFAAADANAAVLISYEYSAVSTTSQIISVSNLQMGAAPTFMAELVGSYAGKPTLFKAYKCLASKFTLPLKNDDYTIPEFDFTCFANAAGQVYDLGFAE